MDYYMPEPEVQDPAIANRPKIQRESALVLQQPLLTPRTIVIGVCVIAFAGAFYFWSSSGSKAQETTTITIARKVAPTSAEVDESIIGNAKKDFAGYRRQTDLKMPEIGDSLLNGRALSLLEQANKNLRPESKSNCVGSPYGTACSLVPYSEEQLIRFYDAASIQKWDEANKALFQLKATRLALDGNPQLQNYLPPATMLDAIRQENKSRLSLLQSSSNAIAAQRNGLTIK